MKKDRKSSMVLAVDIGNTAVHGAVFRGRRMIRTLELDTGRRERNIPGTFRSLLRDQRYRALESVIICSVVPRLTELLEKTFRRDLKKKTCVVGRDVTVPLMNRYRHPRQVGQDRLVGAFAARELFGAPLIIVDLGTAITLDVLSGKQEYLGGIIVPGLRLSAESLHQKTALLPLVKIQKPKRIIGRDTRGSILSGIFYGYAAMIDGLVTRLKKEMAGHPKVIMTGGYAGLMKKFFRHEVIVEKDLVLKGLSFLLRTKM